MKNILFKFLLILLAFISLKTFTGCGGADTEEEQLTEEQIRARDSVKTYTALESARIHYTKALQFNEKADSKSSGVEFEMAVKELNAVDSKPLDIHYNWKKDYTELARSVAQDYITAVSDLPADSKVFSLAKRVDVRGKTERLCRSSGSAFTSLFRK